MMVFAVTTRFAKKSLEVSGQASHSGPVLTHEIDNAVGDHDQIAVQAGRWTRNAWEIARFLDV